MATLEDIRSWNPGALSAAADALVTVRNELVHSSDDLADGSPPASWTTGDAAPATAEIADIESRLATQVAEISKVVSALDTASSSIITAQNDLDAALGRASANGLTVDLVTGFVTSTATFTPEQEAERQDLQRVSDDVAARLTSAREAATAADADLSAVLRAVATTDAASGLSLADLDAFLDLPSSKKIEYLLAHPELADQLLPYASDYVKGELGRELADEFDRIGRDPRQTMLHDPDTLARYAAYLDGFGEDQTVMAAMYTRLGPDGVTAVLGTIGDSMYVASSWDEQASLALALRDGLGVASRSEGFDGEKFGRDLVLYSSASGWGLLPEDQGRAFAEDYPFAGSDASVLDFLMRDGDYSGELIRGVAEELDGIERRHPQAVTTWYHHASSPLDGVGLGGDEWPRPTDPMISVMGQLSRHPDEALRFFDPPHPICTADLNIDAQSRAAYYFGERDWRGDGYESVSRAIHAIGTDPDLRAMDPRGSAMTVSHFFDQITKNEYFRAEDTAPASPLIGDLMKHYVPSIELALDSPGNQPPGLRDYNGSAILDPLYDQPRLDKDEAAKLLDVAFGTKEGTARIAEGFAAYRQTALLNYADARDGLFLELDGSQGTVNSLIKDTARVEGFMQKVLGDADIAEGKSTDERIAVFTGLVSDAVGLLPVPGADAVGDVVGDLGKGTYEYLVNKGIDLTHDQVDAAWASYEDNARDGANLQAQVREQQLYVATHLALVEAGLIELAPGSVDRWMVDGRLISLNDIRPALLDQYVADAQAGAQGYYDSAAVREGYKDQFSEYWKD